jgi:hypothetical protein
MAGRRVFFSFHYEADVWRATIVRNAGIVDANSRAGWTDSSLWEEAKKNGKEEIKRLIDKGLKGTSVTAVLIGTQTASCIIRLKADTGSGRKRTPFRANPDSVPAESGHLV